MYLICACKNNAFCVQRYKRNQFFAIILDIAKLYSIQIPQNN
jgi:hypothetical protein